MDLAKSVQKLYTIEPHPNFWAVSDDKVYEAMEYLYPIFDEIYNPDITKKEKVLVAGCGTGEELIPISKYFHKIHAVDFCEKSLEIAKKNLQRIRKTNIEFQNLDLLNVNPIERKFNYIISRGVIHHTQFPYKALKNLFDLTNKRGQIYLNVYNSFGEWFYMIKLGIINLMAKKDDFEKREKLIKKLRFSQERRSFDYDSYVNPIVKPLSVFKIRKFAKKNGFKIVFLFPYVNPFRNIKLVEKMGTQKIKNPVKKIVYYIFKFLGSIFNQNQINSTKLTEINIFELILFAIVSVILRIQEVNLVLERK